MNGFSAVSMNRDDLWRRLEHLNYFDWCRKAEYKQLRALFFEGEVVDYPEEFITCRELFWSASSNAFQLYVNGSNYNYNTNHATSTSDGREYHYEARRMGNLVVSRRVLVPIVGGAYVRYLEVLDNPSNQEQVAKVRLQSYYGAANDSQVRSQPRFSNRRTSVFL